MLMDQNDRSVFPGHWLSSVHQGVTRFRMAHPQAGDPERLFTSSQCTSAERTYQGPARLFPSFQTGNHTYQPQSTRLFNNGHHILGSKLLKAGHHHSYCIPYSVRMGTHQQHFGQSANQVCGFIIFLDL